MTAFIEPGERLAYDEGIRFATTEVSAAAITARADARRYADTIRAVLTIHANEHGGCGACTHEYTVPWPCPTVVAIGEHLSPSTGADS